MFYKIFFWLIFIYAVYSLFTVDSTDKNYFTRSDLGLKTDYGTGCQYLTTFGGGITPRLDKNGKQICIKEDNNDI